MNRALQLISCGFIILLFSACANYNAGLRKPSIYDGTTYGRIQLPPSTSKTYKFQVAEQQIEIPDINLWGDKKALKKALPAKQYLEATQTTAFLIIRNDTILYENYFNGESQSSVTQLFSITKPLIASFLSQALAEGRIKTLDTPVENYLDLRGPDKNCEQLTLRHLAQMQSGFNHHDYLRLIRITRLYYAKNADNYVAKGRVGRTPGKQFKYKSFDTQVLGMCLEKIFEEDNLMDRFVNTYWNKIGPEYPAYFSIDDSTSNNMKYYGGLNMSARDIAKIGKVYLNRGKFEDQQVIDESWVDNMLDTTNHIGKMHYGFGWYFDAYSYEEPVYYGSGFNGQYVVVNPKNNTIIIRLGKSKAKQEWWTILTNLSKML